MDEKTEAQLKFADRAATIALLWPDINSSNSMIDLVDAFKKIRKEAGYPEKLPRPADQKLLFIRAEQGDTSVSLYFREEVDPSYVLNFIVSDAQGDFNEFTVDIEDSLAAEAGVKQEDGTYKYTVS
jgi:hypothetical protein